MESFKKKENNFTQRFFVCGQCGAYLTKITLKKEKNIFCDRCNNKLREITQNEYQNRIIDYINSEKKQLMKEKAKK
jgi:uncharacterized paraquat-inducible protein A